MGIIKLIKFNTYIWYFIHMIRKPTSLAVVALLMGEPSKAAKLTTQSSNYLYSQGDAE